MSRFTAANLGLRPHRSGWVNAAFALDVDSRRSVVWQVPDQRRLDRPIRSHQATQSALRWALLARGFPGRTPSTVEGSPARPTVKVWPLVRIMFSAAGGHGHLQPVLPIAAAAERRGHHILVSAAPSLMNPVRAWRLPFAASGPDLVPIRSELIMYSLDQEREAIPSDFIGRLGPARARDLIDAGRAWRPDLIVSDEADYGAVIAADCLSVPHATVVTFGAGGLVTKQLVRRSLEALRTTFHLPPEEGTLMLERSIKLNPFPPAFRDPADPLTGRVINYRAGSVPPRRPVRNEKWRSVYVTLGTIFNTESGDLLARIARSVAASPEVDRVIVAAGDHVPAEELQPQPSNVIIHQFAPQLEALAACAAVVCHGGSGTVLDALRYGLPMILLPLGADQPLNAARCKDLGCAIVLPADQVTTQQLSAAVAEVLTASSHHDAARELQAELVGFPELDTLVESLESHTSCIGGP